MSSSPSTSIMSYEGYCPNCGDEGTLGEETGWCLNCTILHIGSAEILFCSECSARFVKDYWHPYFKHCANCRRVLRHEEISEYAERLGVSYSVARKAVKEAKRPRCLSCTNPIKGGRTGVSRFCTTTPQCRRARRSYRYKREKGLTSEQALAEVLKEIHGDA